MIYGQSIEFDFGLYTFVFGNESGGVAMRRTCHREIV